MSVWNLIKSIFKAVFFGLVGWVVISLVIANTTISENAQELLFIIVTLATIVIIPILAWYFYSENKQQTTCPRCKTPFVFYEKEVGSETLSEDYISQDVKDSNGVYRRKSYKIGKERVYYESTCKECGYTTKRDAVRDFKREV